MIRNLMASSALVALISAGAISVAPAQTDPAKPAITQDTAAAAPDTAAPAATVADSSQAIAPEKPTLASAIIGKSVYSSNDSQSDNIGDVNDLIVDEKGEVTHAVVGVGGFLGIGEKNVAVPFDQLKVVENNGDFRLVYSATKEQLEAAPDFDRTAYDPAARAPKSTNTASTDTTGLTPPAPAADTTAAPAAGDQTAATDTNSAAAPATTDATAAPAANDQAAATTDTNSTAAPATTDSTAAPAATDQMAAGTDTNAAPAAGQNAANDFVQTAAVANMFEIQSSQLAKDHAQGDDVKTFAQKMIDDHTKAGDDMKAAVQSANAGMTVPDDLDQEHKDMLDKLQAASGADFDKQYVDIQLKAHDDAVKLFQDFADKGDNPEIKQFAQSTLPTLQDHQKMIHDLSDKLGSTASAAPADNSQQTTADTSQPAATAPADNSQQATADTSQPTATAPADNSQQTTADTSQPAATTPADNSQQTTADTSQPAATAPADNSQQAAADTSQPAATSPAAGGDTGFVNAGADQIAASTLIGKDVYGPENESIGKISDLVLQKEGSTRVALVDVGGFLGIGSKTVAIPFTDLKIAKTDANATPQINVAMTKDQLQNQPEFDKSTLDTASNAPATTGQPAGTTTDNTMAAAPPATTDQSTAPATTGSIDTAKPVSQDIAASKLIGAGVYGQDDSSIGSVNDIVFNDKGDINAVVVDVGGFLGIGAKPVALKFEDLNVRTDESGKIMVSANATKDQLDQAPAYQVSSE